MRRFGLVWFIAVMAFALAAAPVSAGKGWCRSDPIVSLNGVELQFWVAIPADKEQDVIGPIAIVLVAPRASNMTLVYTDPGFAGYGERVSLTSNGERIGQDGSFNVTILVSVPMRGNQFVPMQLEVVPESGARVFVEGETVGMAVTLTLNGGSIYHTFADGGTVMPTAEAEATATEAATDAAAAVETPPAEPTDVATGEPVAEATEEPTAEPTAEATVESGGIEENADAIENDAGESEGAASGVEDAGSGDDSSDSKTGPTVELDGSADQAQSTEETAGEPDSMNEQAVAEGSTDESTGSVSGDDNSDAGETIEISAADVETVAEVDSSEEAAIGDPDTEASETTPDVTEDANARDDESTAETSEPVVEATATPTELPETTPEAVEEAPEPTATPEDDEASSSGPTGDNPGGGD